jgi:AmmeMemoRadiSam system protein B
MQKVRAPVVDEIFYPADREELASLVRRMLDGSSVAPADSSALVVPHAAYSIAGEVLAAGFRAAASREVERVVILAPMHRDPGPNVVLPESQAFLTPLGEAPVDERVVAELEGWSTAIVRSDLPHLEEHAIEVAIPFVQILFPGASVVPILVGPIPQELMRTLARGLAAAAAEKWERTLLLATTNLNGDGGGLRAANAFLGALAARRGARALRPSTRAAAILEGVHAGRITACGAHAVAALLELVAPTATPRLLARCDSGGEARGRTYYAAIALN